MPEFACLLILLYHITCKFFHPLHYLIFCKIYFILKKCYKHHFANTEPQEPPEIATSGERKKAHLFLNIHSHVRFPPALEIPVGIPGGPVCLQARSTALRHTAPGTQYKAQLWSLTGTTMQEGNGSFQSATGLIVRYLKLNPQVCTITAHSCFSRTASIQQIISKLHNFHFISSIFLHPYTDLKKKVLRGGIFSF